MRTAALPILSRSSLNLLSSSGEGVSSINFLVAALDGAIALAQMDDAALVVAQNLDFDVVRVLDEFFDVNAGIAKGLFRLVRAV
jgi:hypothetical protein